MKKKEAVCLGPEGSFSQVALRLAVSTFYFPFKHEDIKEIHVGENKEIVPVFVKCQKPALACLAVHTKAQCRLTGSFEQIMEAVGESKISIICAIEIPISFALLVNEQSDFSSTNLPRNVVSHARGIGACSGFISEHNMISEAVGSNSLAAKMVSSDPCRKYYGALAPLSCKEIYGLREVKSFCEDAPARTMFFILGRGTNLCPKIEDEWRAILIYDILDKPNALGEFVSTIGMNGINMKHIHSVGESDDRYQFLSELEGTRGNLEKFMEIVPILKKLSSKISVLGPFPLSRL